MTFEPHIPPPHLRVRLETDGKMMQTTREEVAIMRGLLLMGAITLTTGIVVSVTYKDTVTLTGCILVLCLLAWATRPAWNGLIIESIKPGTRIVVRRSGKPQLSAALSVVGGRFHPGDTIEVLDSYTDPDGCTILRVFIRPGSRAGRLLVMNGSFEEKQSWTIVPN